MSVGMCQPHGGFEPITMPQESITFVNPDGGEAPGTPGTAEVIRYSSVSRITRATLFVLAGLIGGTACIIVPVVHLFTTWGLPLIGILVAMRTMRKTVVVHQPEGVCPHCKEQIQLSGGALIDDEWQVCPLCKSKLRVRVQAEPMPPTTAVPG